MATAVLWPGVTYQAKLKLGFLAGAAVSNGLMRSKLEEKGFANVMVVSDEDELPLGWPPELAGDGSGVRWVQATWTLPRQEMDVPSQVVRYRALPPPLREAPLLPQVSAAELWQRATLTSEFVEPGSTVGAVVALVALVGVVTVASTLEHVKLNLEILTSVLRRRKTW